VFGPDGRVALALTLFGFRDALPAREVPALAERLLEATAAVTKTVHGRAPET
jgi:DNA-binding IclR family transcriptional regulator